MTDRLTIAAARFGLRYVYEAPTQEQQNRVLKSGLYPLGDVRLIWVNEGDLHMGTAPLPQPTLAALLAERAPEFLAAVRDGWHWLKHPEDLRPFPSAWNAELRGWPSGGVHSPQGVVDLGFDYISPCYTQADLDAAVQAERARGISDMREAVESIRCDRETFNPVPAVAHFEGLAWAKARMGHKLDELANATTDDALDAALAQARREGMLAAAEIAASGKEIMRDGGYTEVEDMDADENVAAIRSAAAGEEGK